MLLIALVVALLIITPSISTKSNGCGTEEDEFDVTPGSVNKYSSNTGRDYTVIIPSSYKHNKQTPLVVVLPGFLTSTTDFYDEFAMDANIESEGYIGVILEGANERLNGESLYGWNDLTSSVSPGCDINDPLCAPIPTCDETMFTDDPPRQPEIQWTGKSQCGDKCNWNSCTIDDIDYIDRIANIMQNNFCIDIEKEYITGFSNGAMMTQTIACNKNSRFAAAAAINGQRHNNYNCAPQDGPPIPFMNIWNTYDTIIPGQDIIARNEWYYTPVQDVQDAFATFNNCDMNQIDEYYTPSDGWKNWQCFGYLTRCDNDAKVIQCQWGVQSTDPNVPNSAIGHTPPYSINANTQIKRNRGIEVIYDFFKQYKRDSD